MFVKVNGETMDAGIADDLGFELTGNFSSARLAGICEMGQCAVVVREGLFVWDHGSVDMTGCLKKTEHQKYERMRSLGFHAQMLCKGRGEYAQCMRQHTHKIPHGFGFGQSIMRRATQAYQDNRFPSSAGS